MLVIMHNTLFISHYAGFETYSKLSHFWVASDSLLVEPLITAMIWHHLWLPNLVQSVHCVKSSPPQCTQQTQVLVWTSLELEHPLWNLPSLSEGNEKIVTKSRGN